MEIKHKVVAVSFVILLVTASHLYAHSIEIGDSRESVVDEMGKPTGFMESGNMETLFYKRGNIMLEDGKVISVAIRSQAQLDKEEAEELEALYHQREAEERARKAHVAAGKREKSRRLNSEEFQRLSPNDQLAQWKSFALEYPEVPIEAILKPLQKKVRGADLEEVTARIAELERQSIELRDRRRITHNDRLRRRYSRQRRELEEQISDLRQRQKALQDSKTP